MISATSARRSAFAASISSLPSSIDAVRQIQLVPQDATEARCGGMVEDHLRDHPGEEFGPTAIAKALGGKSSGAVSNALDKLASTEIAVKINNSLKRFTLASAEREVFSAAAT